MTPDVASERLRRAWAVTASASPAPPVELAGAPAPEWVSRAARAVWTMPGDDPEWCGDPLCGPRCGRSLGPEPDLRLLGMRAASVLVVAVTALLVLVGR